MLAVACVPATHFLAPFLGRHDKGGRDCYAPAFYTEVVLLTRADGWILGAIRDAGRWTKLVDMIGNAHWLNTDIPTFDHVSYGVPRLQASGFVEVTGTGTSVKLRVTEAGKRIVDDAHRGTNSRGQFLMNMAEAFHAPPYPLPEQEDRSLGRWTALDEETYNRAIEGWHKKFWSVLGNDFRRLIR